MSDPLAALLADAPLAGASGRCRWVACLVASVDGRAAIDGRVGALTGEADQALLRGLRARADAIVVSGATTRAEGYGRPLADGGAEAEPALVVVSPSGEAGDEARPDHVVRERDDDALGEALRAHARDGGWRLAAVEGGPSLVARLVRIGLLDEMVVSTSPRLVGDPAQPALLGDAPLETADLRLVAATVDGGHVFARWAVR